MACKRSRDQVIATRSWPTSTSSSGTCPRARACWLDETHINLLPWVRVTWITHGTRQEVMTPGTNRRRTIFGAIDQCTGRLLYQITRRAVGASFTAFCEQLLAAYPAAPMMAVVCDNVIIHHSTIVQRRPAWC
jgi:hypothetical protein